MTALAVVLLAITGLLLWAPKDNEPADPDATAQVWELEPDDVVAVRIVRAADTVVLERQGEVWWLLEPSATLADPEMSWELLDALGEMDRGVPVQGDPADFGLSPRPVAEVEVELVDGRLHKLELGKASPVGFRTYARLSDGALVAVNGRPGDVLAVDAHRFRDHRVVDFAPEAVRAIRIVGPQGTLAVSGRGLRWWLEGHTRADPDRVDDLALALLDLRFDRFADGQNMPDPPRYVVEIGLEEREPLRVLVGEDRRETLVHHGGVYGYIAEERLVFLGQGPTDIGDPSAFGLDVVACDAVVVERAGVRWEARRNGNAWEQDGRESPEAWAVIDALAAARIHYRPEPVPPVGPRWARVEITQDDRVWAVEIGSVHAGRYRIARDERGGEPYLVVADALAVLDALP